MKALFPVAMALSCLVLAACASGPRGTYFDEKDSARHAVVVARHPDPAIGVLGILVEERDDPSGHVRSVHTEGSALSSLLQPLTRGLRENPALRLSVVRSAPIQIDCSPPAAIGMTKPEDAPCKVDGSLTLPPTGNALELPPLTHVLVVIGWSARTTGGRAATWGIGPGAPAVTTETSFTVYSKVSARLFDLRSGALLTEATAIDGGGGSYGVMLTFIPYFAGPSQSALLEATSHAVGAEVARRLRLAGKEEPSGSVLR